jgi:hypothetical protein
MTEGGDGGGGAGGDERDWAIWLRLLSHSVRDTAGSASTDDTAVLQAVEIPFLPSFLLLLGPRTWAPTFRSFQFSRLSLLHCSFLWWIRGASFRWGSCTSSVRSKEVVTWWLEFIHHLQNCSSAAVHLLFHRSDRAQVFFSWYVFFFCH